MKATGIVRRVDDLGRIVIPKEIRRTLRIREGDPVHKIEQPPTRWVEAVAGYLKIIYLFVLSSQVRSLMIYLGRCLVSMYILPTYWPITPKARS